jgi:sterol desaturase/sphingolipid hydroxylase (fatty acid hydroxylase superfamily)
LPKTAIAAEPPIRLGCFLGVLVLMALWEALTPRRQEEIGRLRRWPNNFGLVALNTVAVRLVFPLAGVGIALFAQSKGWGLFNAMPLPAWLTVPLAVILLDLTIYGQHVAFHAVPALWRLHRVHHADLEFDVTTGLRFHPGEILLSYQPPLTSTLPRAGMPLIMHDLVGLRRVGVNGGWYQWRSSWRPS